MILEAAAGVIAIAFVLLVGYLVPLLIQARRAVAESQQFLARMNHELPPLIAELRSISRKLDDLADQARGGVQHAAVLLHAAGQVGESVQQVRNLVRGSRGSVVANLVSLMAGVRAAKDAVKGRMKEGGIHNGG